jgi:acetyl-CoA acetyltransferase
MAIEQIDLFEVNEAFAAVPLARLKTLGGDPDKLDHRLDALSRPSSAQRAPAPLSNCGGIANATILEAPH